MRIDTGKKLLQVIIVSWNWCDLLGKHFSLLLKLFGLNESMDERPRLVVIGFSLR